MDYVRVVGALGLVIALIVLLKWVGRILFPSVAGRGSSRVVEVLSRSSLTPKQQVMLIRVGSRLIVVGDSGTQMNTLCEIADADEVASLIGQLRDEKSAAVSAFNPLFGRFRKRFETPPEEEPAPLADEEPLSIDSAESELHGLRERVRQLAEQFK
jgi:flagellar biogenesis protein FliO